MEITRSLVMDMGNTRRKAGVFEGDTLIHQIVLNADDTKVVQEIINHYQPALSIISSVGEPSRAIPEILQKHTRFVELTPELALPFTNLYATPQTLGMDRVAGVAGAMFYFPGKACLVIDMGTCITFDFINAHSEYLGGAISPGLNMRLEAMATFTKRLPKLQFEQPGSFIGNSTQTSMLSGAYFGILGEINDTVARYEEQFGNVEVLLCGGDAPLFDKHTKKNIFAAPDLVLYGLHHLLRYNAT